MRKKGTSNIKVTQLSMYVSYGNPNGKLSRSLQLIHQLAFSPRQINSEVRLRNKIKMLVVYHLSYF